MEDWQPDVTRSSWDLLSDLKDEIEAHVGYPPEHRTPGDQFGIQREWVIDGFGGMEIVALADAAWTRTARILEAAHSKYASQYPWEAPDSDGPHHDMTVASVFLESDENPLLPSLWDWPDDWEARAEGLYSATGPLRRGNEVNPPHCPPPDDW